MESVFGLSTFFVLQCATRDCVNYWIAVTKVFLAEADDESFYLWYAYQEHYTSNETVTIFEPDGDITVCTVSEDNVIVCI